MLGEVFSELGLGEGLPGLGSIVKGISGLFGSSGSSKRWTNHWNTVARDMSYDFAKNAIQWKVEDAKKAGLHPAFAIGAATPSASPSFSIPGDGGSRGQDITRALGSFLSREDRGGLTDMEKRLNQAKVENAELQNDLLRSQIRVMSQPGTGPGMQSTWLGQGDGARVLPSEVITGSDGTPARQPGHITEYQYTAPDRYGRVGIVPSKEGKERMEDDFIQSLLWHGQHRFAAPPAPKGYVWDFFAQKYVPRPKSRWDRRNLLGF